MIARCPYAYYTMTGYTVYFLALMFNDLDVGVSRQVGYAFIMVVDLQSKKFT